MRFLNNAVLGLLLVMILPLSVAAQQQMIGYAGFAGFQVSMWAVKDLGLLKKYGRARHARSRRWWATAFSSLTSMPPGTSER
jgi:hypothetical protein